jgi:L-iditol 2-dehydrogenase
MVEDPSIQKDEILAKVKACGICGTDIHAYKMGNTSASKKPLILGHKFSGEIVEVGPAVDGLRAGIRCWVPVTAPAECAIGASEV